MSESLTAKVRRTPTPVNRMAARVISTGTHYDERAYTASITSDEPLATRAYPATADPSHDLTGQVFGRLTAIGLSPTYPTWVVRCACGKYTTRRAKALKSAAGRSNLMCSRCDHMEQKKIGHNSRGLKAESLQEAGLPMYEALAEILQHGITPATRHSAEIALAIAEKERFA